MSLAEVQHIKAFGRIQNAIKAAWYILTNKAIICIYQDSSIFARSNPMFMHLASKALETAANTVIAEETLDAYKELMDIPEHRNN